MTNPDQRIATPSSGGGVFPASIIAPFIPFLIDQNDNQPVTQGSDFAGPGGMPGYPGGSGGGGFPSGGGGGGSGVTQIVNVGQGQDSKNEIGFGGLSAGTWVSLAALAIAAFALIKGK